jgi:hypothetical protein
MYRRACSVVPHLRVRRAALTASLVVLLCGVPAGASGQSRLIRIVDESAQPVRTATVTLTGLPRAVAADSSGLVTLSSAELRGTLTVRAVGYVSVVISADSLRNLLPPGDTIRIRIETSNPLLGAVEVTGDRPVIGGASMSREVVRRLPPLGEPDVLRVLPFVGGIAQPNDIRPRFHLAGAAGDETLVTLDGHPMQSGLHFDGLLGAFNFASLDRADVLMHEVAAGRRSRLGGVVALETRLPESEPTGEVGVSVATASSTVSAPIGEGSILLSARATWLGQVLQQLLRDGPVPDFRDGLLRVSHPLFQRADLTLLGFSARNAPVTVNAGLRSGIETDEHLLGAQLRLRALGASWSVRTSHSSFTVQPFANDGPVGEPEARQRWLAGSLDGEWRAQQHWLALHAAVDDRAHRFAWNRPRDNPLLPRRLDDESQQRLAHAAVAGGSGAQTVRYDGAVRLTSNGRRAWLAPQFGTTWYLRPGWSLGASVHRRWQFDTQYGEPVPSGDPPPVFLLQEPRRMDGGALSLAWNGNVGASQRETRLEVTAFARQFAERTLPDGRSPLASFPSPADAPLMFRRVSARAHGISSTLSMRSTRGSSLQLAYTWQRAWQQDSVGEVRAAWDIPHTLTALASMPLGRRFELSGVVVGRSGATATPVVGALLIPVNAESPFRSRVGTLNSARLPHYLRFDAMLRWHGRVAETDVALKLQLINALARRNVMAFAFDGLGSARPTDAPTPANGLPLIPTLGLEVRW